MSFDNKSRSPRALIAGWLFVGAYCAAIAFGPAYVFAGPGAQSGLVEAASSAAEYAFATPAGRISPAHQDR